MEVVEHQGRETAYRQSDLGGSGGTILCVHGSGGTRDIWKSQFRLADRRPVAALDLSGHGDSDDVDAAPGYETLGAYTDDVLAVADAVDATVFVGNSLGGAVLLHAILDRDLDPEALVLTGTGARLPVLKDLLTWLDSNFEQALEFLHQPGRLFADPDEKLVATSKTLMRECGQEVVRRDFRTCHQFSVAGRLDEIPTPSLALVGEEDKLTPRWYHEELANTMPNCELAVVENAGHLAMIEQPEAFNAGVEALLDSL